jgi:hypothetical protein
MARQQKKSNDVNVKTFTGNTAGGGSATNKTGLTFEEYIDNVFSNQISKSENISIDGNKIIKDGKVYASRYSKHKLYNMLCVELGIKWKDIFSKKLLPDDAILVHETNTIYIVEKKYQKSSGSNDEKIQTAPYKIRQYNRLFKGTGIKVDFCYVLSDWFKLENNPSYEDMLTYLDDNKVKYYYNELPLNHIGL